MTRSRFGASDLYRRLRVIVITDPGIAAPRSVESVVLEALEAGAPAVQLRDKSASAGALLGQARALRTLTSRYGALFFVNDRTDVALACGADGVHLGPDDIPVEAVRAAVPDGFLIGYSTDEPDVAVEAVRHGADYLGCGAVFATTSKSDAGEVIGPEGLARVVRAVGVPVVGIGGVDATNVGEVAGAGAAGAAVIGAVMGAGDVGRVVSTLIGAWNT